MKCILFCEPWYAPLDFEPLSGRKWRQSKGKPLSEYSSSCPKQGAQHGAESRADPQSPCFLLVHHSVMFETLNLSGSVTTKFLLSGLSPLLLRDIDF